MRCELGTSLVGYVLEFLDAVLEGFVPESREADKVFDNGPVAVIKDAVDCGNGGIADRFVDIVTQRELQQPLIVVRCVGLERFQR